MAAADMHFDAETVTHRAGLAKLRSQTKINPRLASNLAKCGFKSLDTHKGFSTYVLPQMLERSEQFDLIYVGGMMVLDDYWHDISEIGGPGVKQAVDQFHAAFGRYFEVAAVYRQVALVKTAEIPR